MQLDIMFEHGVALGRVALDPFVDVEPADPAGGAQPYVSLDACQPRERAVTPPINQSHTLATQVVGTQAAQHHLDSSASNNCCRASMLNATFIFE